MSTARKRLGCIIKACSSSISASAVPVLQCQRSDRIHAGQSGDIARCRIKAMNGPLSCNGLIAAACYEPRAFDRIEIKLDAAKISRQADAQSFDRCLLVCPQNKECVALGRSLQSSQDPAFRRSEIALRNVYDLRKITHFLDVDA